MFSKRNSLMLVLFVLLLCLTQAVQVNCEDANYTGTDIVLSNLTVDPQPEMNDWLSFSVEVDNDDGKLVNNHISIQVLDFNGLIVRDYTESVIITNDQTIYSCCMTDGLGKASCQIPIIPTFFQTTVEYQLRIHLNNDEEIAIFVVQEDNELDTIYLWLHYYQDANNIMSTFILGCILLVLVGILYMIKKGQ